MKKILFSLFSLLSLLLCLVSPFLHFLGRIGERDYKWIFLLASLSWFTFSSLWASVRKKAPRS